jgi:hypothetical protein
MRAMVEGARLVRAELGRAGHSGLHRT